MGLAAVIGALRANLTLDTTQFNQGINNAKSAIRGFAATIPALSGETKALGYAIQNAARQFTDMGVQLSMSTPIALVMSQQLPQLAAGFGVVGEVIGTVIAGGFLGWMLSSKEGIKELDKAIQDLAESSKTFVSDTTDALTPLSQLIDKYGALSHEVQQLNELRAKVSEAGFLRDYAEGINQLIQTFGNYKRTLTDAEKEAQGYLETNTNLKESFQTLMGVTLPDNWTALADVFNSVKDKFDATDESAKKIVQSLIDIQNASNFDDKVQSISDLSVAVTSVIDPTKTLTKEQQDLIDKIIQLSQSGLDAAASMAKLGDASVGAAARAAQAAAIIKESIQAGLEARDKLSDRKDENLDPEGGLNYLRSQQARRAAEQQAEDEARLSSFRNKILNSLNSPPDKPAKAHKAPKTEEEKAFERLKREAKSFYESVRDPQTEYNDKLEEMTLYLSKGLIDTDTAKMATKKLTQDYQDSMNDILGITVITSEDIRNTFTDSFAGILTGATSLKEGLADIFTKIGSMFISAGINNLLSSTIPGLGGSGPLPIPGFASGVSNFRGGLAMVGEHGPELAALPRGTSIMPNRKLSSLGGSTVNTFSPTINAPNSDARALAQVRADQQAMFQDMKRTFGDKVMRTINKPRFRGGY